MKWCAVLSNGFLEKLYDKDPFLNCDFWIESIPSGQYSNDHYSNRYSIDNYVIHSSNFNIQNMSINGWKINTIRDAYHISYNSSKIVAQVEDPRGKQEMIYESNSDFLGASNIVKKIVLISKYSSWAVSRQAENAEKFNSR